MSILLTGGAGYIGSVVAEVLKESGEDIVVIDNLSSSKESYLPEDVKFYKGSIDNIDLLNKILDENKIDAVMHFAAYIEAGESVLNPYKYFNNNFSSTITLFNHLISNGIKKIIFSSTAAVYGEPDYTPIDEVHSTLPINPYGMSKLFTERYLEAEEIAHSINYVALRYFNASGAYKYLGENHDPETHIIPLILQVALGIRDKIYINGNNYDTKDGTCIRDYIHVYDIAQAHLLAYKYLSDNTCSLKINLGSGHGFSILDIINSCRKITSHAIPSEVRERRTGDPAILIASSKLAEDLLGWKRSYNNVDDIIESAWKYHKEGRG